MKIGYFYLYLLVCPVQSVFFFCPCSHAVRWPVLYHAEWMQVTKKTTVFYVYYLHCNIPQRCCAGNCNKMQTCCTLSQCIGRDCMSLYRTAKNHTVVQWHEWSVTLCSPNKVETKKKGELCDALKCSSQRPLLLPHCRQNGQLSHTKPLPFSVQKLSGTVWRTPTLLLYPHLTQVCVEVLHRYHYMRVFGKCISPSTDKPLSIV